MLNLGSKKSASFDLSDLPRLIQSEEPAAAAAEMEALRKNDKSWMKQETVACTYDNFQLQSGQNRYTITHKDVPFECLYLPANNKKLYVMFSGGGSGAKRRYPLFLRWKYQNHLNGNMLCFDDPMYHFHPEMVRVMWYYGTKEQSYLALLVEIVKKAMKQLGIKAEDVTFIGSSGGGHASLYCANLLDHSSSISMNPQVILKSWDYPIMCDHFKNWGIDLEGDDPLGRNVIRLTNPTSRFMLILNANSKKEFATQFTEFAKLHGITPKFGITQHNNILTWVHATDYTETHSANPEKLGILFSEYLLRKVRDGADISEVNALSLFFTESLHEKFELKTIAENTAKEMNTIYKYFVKSISRTIEETLYRRIPMQASPALRRYLEYNFEVETKAWKPGNIGYYIGEQRGFRYNIFYHNGKVFYRMKFDGYPQYFTGKEEMEAALDALKGEKLTRWYYENDTFVMTLALNADTAETQIADFTDLSMEIINKYLK